MKLIDCFMYFDEDLVLDIRLNTLGKVVDKFIICAINWKSEIRKSLNILGVKNEKIELAPI